MERLGRITTSLPDLPIDRSMTYGAMRRAIVGLPEQMYDGNSWDIAQELEVTQQVLGDFRQIMAEHVCIV